MKTSLELKNIKKSFTQGEGVLKGISLSIAEGEFITFLGASGCGKTTTLRIIAGLETPDEGSVYLDGKDVTKLEPNLRDVNTVFQNYALFPHMNVEENIGYGLKLKKTPKAEIKKKVKEMLELVQLEGYEKRKPSELSGGQKQRVAIARALASDPKILLCDEATSALDPQTTSSILELLKKINKQFGITIVIITHQMSVVREICTHVAIMYEGEVVEKGLVADIFANPQSEVAKELIRKDTGSDIDADSRLDAGREKGQAEIKSGEKIRIVFSENSAFEPVIANLILTFGEPVNILKADTKNVGGVAKGEMILEFMEGSTRTEMMKQYLKEKGLAIGEVTEYVGS